MQKFLHLAIIPPHYAKLCQKTPITMQLSPHLVQNWAFFLRSPCKTAHFSSDHIAKVSTFPSITLQNWAFFRFHYAKVSTFWPTPCKTEHFYPDTPAKVSSHNPPKERCFSVIPKIGGQAFLPDRRATHSLVLLFWLFLFLYSTFTPPWSRWLPYHRDTYHQKRWYLT